jgi:SSS family solute:Na+ symporter
MFVALQTVQATVMMVCFGAVIALGLLATRWRHGDMSHMDEWALGGRSFGGVLTWFLQGGSIYTTYAYIAIPALVFGSGAIGFYALPYLALAFPIAYVFVPRLWQIARDQGFTNSSHYILYRFQSPSLALVISLTGIIALVPYVSLQVYGIEICVAQIGLPVQLSLWFAFALLAVVTYVSGLRSAVLIAVFKDVFLWATILFAVVDIPLKLGGFAHVLHAIPPSAFLVPRAKVADFVTLSVGSAVVLFLWPHAITGALTAKSGAVVRRNCVYLPVYTLMLGALALMGYMARVAHVTVNPHYGANDAIPALFDQIFPAPVAGLALAAMAIGAVVPAAVMSISAANLIAENVWRPFLRPAATEEQVTRTAKRASLVVKFAAVGFIVVAPHTYVLNFQLAGAVWMLQAAPSVFLALVMPWLRRGPVLVGWIAGMTFGTVELALHRFTTASAMFSLGGHTTMLYVGVPAVVVNVGLAVGGSALAHWRDHRLTAQGPTVVAS